MSNWIDQIKQEDERQVHAKRKDDELHLHVSGIVQAKAPAFWKGLIDQIQIDLNTLRDTFPNDNRRQGDLIQRGQKYELQGKKLPITILELSLDLNRLCIEVQKSVRTDRTDQSLFHPIDPIKMNVDINDELYLSWRTARFTDPAALAESLIKTVFIP